MNEYMKQFQEKLIAADAEGKTILVSRYEQFGWYGKAKPMTAERAFRKYCITVYDDEGRAYSPYEVEIVE